MDTNRARSIFTHILVFLSALQVISCSQQLRDPSNGEQQNSTRLIQDFIRCAYAQNVEKIKQDGIDLAVMSEVASKSYQSRLVQLSDSYRSKKQSLETFERETLERIFSSETNFSLLRPWSYQPVASSLRVLGGDSDAVPSQLTVCFNEVRWSDSTKQNAVFYLIQEGGKTKVDDIRWFDVKPNDLISKRLLEIIRALQQAGTLDEFEKGAADAL